MNRDQILYKAIEILDDRAENYGSAKDSFERIASIWSAYLETDIQSHDVALMMIMLKACRLNSSSDHVDSWIDICGYAALAGEITSESANSDIELPLQGRQNTEPKKQDFDY